MSRFEKKNEEESRGNPFAHLEKTRVLQEAKAFNEMPINNKKCTLILTKVLYLISQGVSIGNSEATETFFAMTKLFQSKDEKLRRLVYLAIKELSTVASDVIIVTSSLTKDMTGKEDVYRASAIRALCTITDSSMLQAIERYLKQAIVDKSPAVSSAAIVSSLHLAKENSEMVKRWLNEIQQTLSAKSAMTPYHALGLLHYLKQRDRLAISKLVLSQLSNASLKTPLGTCLLIKQAAKVIEADPLGSDKALFDFIESCLRNKSEMVMYEAARAIVNLPNASSRELTPAISVLQMFLTSSKATLRFAAVRTLNKVAMMHPAALKTCNLDMENLVTDSNRSIATLAITTLLKIGNENSVDRLVKQISSFMAEISDDFKIFVVDALRSLCIKFPKKYPSMLEFLAQILRDEGGFEYKKAIVECIVSIIENVPEAKEAGLGHLCEFIEDCEYDSLLIKVLHMLGDQGPSAPHPTRYIRYVYNRIILESSTVRAAAVTALAKFGVQCAAVRPSIIVLLRRCLFDGDDEVRDRATYYLNLIEHDAAAAAKHIVNPLPYVVSVMEKSLVEYVAAPRDTPFDVKSLPIETTPVSRTRLADSDAVSVGSSDAAKGGMKTPASSSEPVAAPREAYAAQLKAVPQFAKFGPLFKSSAPVELTESETEYVVQCIKHVFATHVVLQFNMKNTLNDQQLEDVEVKLESADVELDKAISIKCPLLKYDVVAPAYVAFPVDPTNTNLSFTAKLEFIVKDCDPETGESEEEGYEDTYVIEDVDLSMSDFMLGVDKPAFAAAWEALDDAHQAEGTFELSTMTSLEDAVQKLTAFFGMEPCEKSNKINPTKSSHTLYLAGVYVGGHEVLARAKLVFDQGVSLQLEVRSSDEEIAELVCNAVG